MALNADVVWEVRTDGDDNNGGGFNSSSSGTDYSQQSTAQLTITDAATPAIGSTTLTSVTGGFTSAMVGNIIHLYSGTNLTEGWYEITGYTDTNTVTLDRAPDDGVGGVSGATCKVGGCLASPGGLGVAFNSALESGHYAWIRSGTYQIISDTTNVSGGPFNAPGSKSVIIEGYGTIRGDKVRPLITKASGLSSSSSYFMMGLYGGSNATQRIRYIACDGSGYTSNTAGFKHTGNYAAMFEFCTVSNCLYGYYGGRCFQCYAEDCKYGYSALRARYCVAKNCTSLGYRRSGNVCCIADGCQVGFGNYYGTMHTRCIAYNSVSHGFQTEDEQSLIECLAVNNGGYGFANAGKMIQLLYCCAYGNATDFQTTPDPDDTITITGDPFVDAANGDFRLNDTVGAGAVLRGAGLGVYGQTDNQDIGAVQHADTIGGGAFIISGA